MPPATAATTLDAQSKEPGPGPHAGFSGRDRAAVHVHQPHLRDEHPLQRLDREHEELEVVELENAVAVGATVLREKPDLVLLDLNLPKKDGREVLEETGLEPDLRDVAKVVERIIPDDRGEVAVEATEPGVAAIVGGAGLGRHRERQVQG